MFMTVSGDQVSLVEENTREQASSCIWYQQKIWTCYGFKIQNYNSHRSIKAITIIDKDYPDLYSFKSAACKYGVEHEDIARKECLKYILILKFQLLD